MSTSDPFVLALPVRGRLLVQNSPADAVPSHGTDRFGLSHAIDLVPVDDAGRSAPRTWRSWVRSEPPERFVGFGRPVLAPASGVVVWAHDGESDGVARRAPLVTVGFALTQERRVRAGVEAVAGNHVVIELDGAAGFLWVVHLRRRSVRVEPGDVVGVGDQLGECGNSGNSTEPHVHVHLADSAQWRLAHGRPIAFAGYRTITPDGRQEPAAVGMPHNGEVIEGV